MPKCVACGEELTEIEQQIAVDDFKTVGYECSNKDCEHCKNSEPYQYEIHDEYDSMLEAKEEMINDKNMP